MCIRDRFAGYKLSLSMDAAYVRAYYPNGFNIFNELPLHLCNINLFLIPLGVWKRHRSITVSYTHLTLTKLHRYMDADYVKENPYIYLSVKGEDMVFQITACFITDIDFDYIAPNPTGEELTNFFEQVARKNWLEFDGVSFGDEDTVLTLSTCCRKYDEYNTGNQRLVLMAKLLPEGAIAQDFTVRLAPEPEMP